MKTVYLVSCVSKKAASPTPAQDLYRSDWFTKTRGFVLQRLGPSDQWYILSAEHHLVQPQTLVEPYERTLLRMRKDNRRAWADHVLRQLQEILEPADHIVFLAGERYREFLEADLIAGGFDVQVPMRGLGIGQQMQWLIQQIRNAAD